VFGESLFNDGVTVVLYNTFIAMVNMEVVGTLEIIMAHLSFLFVVLGGTFIGVFNGLFASYVTTFTQHVRVAEPLVLYSFAYMSFLVAEVFHWSGIISIIAYGITVKRYGFQNISKKSYTTVKYSIKTLASTSDCIIFLFLGLELIQQSHHLHIGFIVATILLCLVFRFISTYLFAFLVNIWRKDKIDLKSQFIMAYGGLRGAVGFSLAVVLKSDLWYRELFLTTCLAMVFFTVFLQGSTIKLFVKLFNIQLQEKKQKRICNDIQSKLMGDIMEGVGAVVGRQKAQNCCYDFFRAIDKTFKSILISKYWNCSICKCCIVSHTRRRGHKAGPTEEVRADCVGRAHHQPVRTEDHRPADHGGGGAGQGEENGLVR
jgi:sodium/hydrogen exchanger 3